MKPRRPFVDSRKDTAKMRRRSDDFRTDILKEALEERGQRRLMKASYDLSANNDFIDRRSFALKAQSITEKLQFIKDSGGLYLLLASRRELEELKSKKQSV
jgi:hypothetical protein